jgi:PAS domain S-box-containing protein
MPSLPPIAELLADARIAALVAAPTPALLFNAEGGLLFANPAGLKLVGAATLPEAATRPAAELGPIAEAMLRLAPHLPAAGAPRLERIRMAGTNFMQPGTFGFSRIAVGEHAEAVLVAGLDAGREKTPSLSRAVSVLLDDSREAFALFDPDGTLIEANTLASVAIGNVQTLQALGPKAEAALAEIKDNGRAEIGLGLLRIVFRRIGSKTQPAVLALFADAPQPENQPAEAEPITAAKPAAPRAPSRFVWRTDSEDIFSSVSPELAAVVGGDNADIAGLDWQTAAARIGITRADEVAAAIARRDTWSGVTVLWPISGSGTAHPVDLAALPVFDRERRFQGYRGFGVFREPVALPATAAPEPAASQPKDEPEEVPVLIERPENVVHFRTPPTPPVQQTLSPSERNTFREIARAIGERIDDVNGKPIGVDPAAAKIEVPQPAAPATVEAAPSGERALLDRLPLGIVVHRGEDVLFANRAALEWIDLPNTETLQDEGGLHRLFAGVPPLGEAADEMSHVLAIAGRDGVPIPVEARLVSIPWEGESALVYILSRATGKSSRREASELKLRDAEALSEELRGILDTATDGILLIDRDGNILSLNRSAEALFGYDSNEIEGQSFTRLFAPESHRAAHDYLDGLAENGVASLLNDGREIIGQVREGGLIPVFMTLGRVGEGTQKFCAVFRDITQWKRAEEELMEAKRKAEQSSSAKSDFLARISHEIRTPLNAIIGFADVMREERFGPIGNERYREYLKDIQTSGAHLISLINDLLDLSKIEAGKVELSFSSVDLNDVARQCMAIMQPQANRERIIIRTSLFPDLPQVVADVRSVRQIALNLLSNSIKFTPPGGQVIVSTQLTDDGEVLLRVRDTGVGMSETEVATAMEPFRQLSTTTGGSGLGLPLTKALTEANRASFTVKSGVNAGTLVEILFPSNRVLAS